MEKECFKLLNQEQIEFYHNLGLMPDWVYYQVNGKSIRENYRDWHNKKPWDKFLAKYKEEQEEVLQKEIEDEIIPKIENAIDELLEDFSKP